MPGHNSFLATAKDFEGSWFVNPGGRLPYSPIITQEAYLPYEGSPFSPPNKPVKGSTSTIPINTWYHFRGDGTYEGIRNAPDGFNGHVRGTYTVTDSKLRATNWLAGKTKSFHTRIEVIKKHRMLILTDTDDPSSVQVLFPK